MDLNKLPYWKDIWKLKFNLKKCKVLYIGTKNIKVDYKLSNREIKKVYEKCDVWIKSKADKHILSVASRTNGMIS